MKHYIAIIKFTLGDKEDPRESIKEKMEDLTTVDPIHISQYMELFEKV